MEMAQFVHVMSLSAKPLTSSDAVKVRNNVAAVEDAAPLTAAPLVSTSFAAMAMVGGVPSAWTDGRTGQRADSPTGGRTDGRIDGR